MLSIALFLSAFDARAGDFEFSRAGNIVIEGQTNGTSTPFINVSNSHSDDGKGDTSTTTSLSFDLRVHRFFCDRFSLGFEIFYSLTLQAKGTETADVIVGEQSVTRVVDTGPGKPWSLQARLLAGYDLPIGKDFSYWPRVSVGVTHSTTGANSEGYFTEQTQAFFDLDAAFCWHPLPHVALSVGPTMTVTFAAATVGIEPSYVTDSKGNYVESKIEFVEHEARGISFHWAVVRFIAWF
jgi:hypothetical protein